MELKPIKGFENEYLISDTGKVFSEMFRNNKTAFKRRKELSLCCNGHGYKYITLSKAGKKERFYVHRLVAEHFLKPAPDGAVINHKDHNRSNNDVSNLEWVTQADNVKYSACLMAHPKSKCKPTSTGEKYITYCKRGKAHYRLNLRKLHIDTYFNTLEEAVAFRDMVLGGDNGA